MNIPPDINRGQTDANEGADLEPTPPPDKVESETSAAEEKPENTAQGKISSKKKSEPASEADKKELSDRTPHKQSGRKRRENSEALKTTGTPSPARKGRSKRSTKNNHEQSLGDGENQSEAFANQAEKEDEEQGISSSPDSLLAKKTHRGKRGGRKRAHKQEQSQASTGIMSQPAPKYLSVEELCKIPALPPGMDFVHELVAICESEVENIQQKSKNGSKKAQQIAAPMRRMLISVIPGEQVEVGLAEEGTLLEYYLDMLRQSKLKGNIYKGIIHNIDPNLQAAFVDFGVGKNGFLQIDEVHPEYWQGYTGENGDKKKLPPIQKVLKPGQEILVQVVKEPSGNKGAFLTTWLSLAGRFLVLTPGQEQVGVSRKVTDPEERQRLREMMNGLSPGAGLGVIVRTVGEGATKTTLRTDLQYLKRLWKEIRKKVTESSAPALIHQEPGLSERAVRDYLTDDISEIWVDDKEEAENVKAMAGLLFPRKKNLVHVYEDKSRSLWDHFNLRKQLEQVYAREVPLPSGGRLVFDQTEALMAIDINSGRISGKGNFEAMAFKTNVEASVAIARQLRLRDIGGQVVIDFIEMREKKHVQEVEKALRQAMKNDRARHDVAHISSFGLLELVRQRMGSSALSLSMEICTACAGTGLRRNLEWQALQCIRDLSQKMKNANGEKFTCEYPQELGLYLLNYKREALRKLENDFGKTLEIKIKI